MWRRKNRPNWPGHATVPEAVRYLASACDGAVRRDGHGFSSDHVQAGHWLAGLPDEAWGTRRTTRRANNSSASTATNSNAPDSTPTPS